MIINNKKSGFSAVELLVTLFVASLFLISGYQLYTLIIKDGGETRAQAKADNTAYEYLKKYEQAAVNPCVASTPVNNEAVTIGNLANPTVTVAITCPYTANLSISKVSVTINYNNSYSQSEASYVNAQ